MAASKAMPQKSGSRHDRVVSIARHLRENSANESAQAHDAGSTQNDATNDATQFDDLRKYMDDLHGEDRRYLLRFFSRITHAIASLRNNNHAPR